MIKVERLTKRYGSVTAVDAIDFEVEKGEIVGMLGPNGAGKSTTVRMLACYLPPTSGRAEVAGCDVFRESLRAREHIGYMPEHVPAAARHAGQRVSRISRGYSKVFPVVESRNVWRMSTIFVGWPRWSEK